MKLISQSVVATVGHARAMTTARSFEGGCVLSYESVQDDCNGACANLDVQNPHEVKGFVGLKSPP